MNEELIKIISSYRKKGVVVDTNLLLLLLIGLFDKKQIIKFKRTSSYSIEDFELLLSFLNNFQNILYTPNILTEVTNLADSINISPEYHFFNHIKLVLLNFSEAYVPAIEIFRNKSFLKFGATDAVNEFLASDYLILTNDIPLFAFLENSGLPTINFNHLKYYF